MGELHKVALLHHTVRQREATLHSELRRAQGVCDTDSVSALDGTNKAGGDNVKEAFSGSLDSSLEDDFVTGEQDIRWR